MKRVTGIGGIFFSAKDPVALRAWYKQHLGIDVQEWGGAAFDWADAAGNPTKGTFDAAEKNGKAADLQKELVDLFSTQNTSTHGTKIPATFLRVTVAR